MSKLSAIADGMLAHVSASPYSSTRFISLPGGLVMALIRHGDDYRLILRRENVPPSPVEVDVVRSAFRVEIVTPHSYVRVDEHPVTKRRITYRCVDLCWRQAEPVPAA